jgi:hypothetical protein
MADRLLRLALFALSKQKYMKIIQVFKGRSLAADLQSVLNIDSLTISRVVFSPGKVIKGMEAILLEEIISS